MDITTNGSPFPAVAFDMDGLIFDTENLSKNAFICATRDYSIEVEEDYYKRFIGNSQPVCDQLMYDRFGHQFDAEGFRALWWQYVGELFRTQGVAYKPGFHQLFKLLKKNNVALALVTTSSHSTVLRNFEGWDYPSKFDTLITCDRGLKSKPAPDKYLAAADDLGVDAKDLLVLEDSNTGMQAAINASCKAIMVPDLVEPTDYVKTQAFQIFNSLVEVDDWLQKEMES